jgi:hypothetical protein
MQTGWNGKCSKSALILTTCVSNRVNGARLMSEMGRENRCAISKRGRFFPKRTKQQSDNFGNSLLQKKGAKFISVAIGWIKSAAGKMATSWITDVLFAVH